MRKMKEKKGIISFDESYTNGNRNEDIDHCILDYNTNSGVNTKFLFSAKKGKTMAHCPRGGVVVIYRNLFITP